MKEIKEIKDIQKLIEAKAEKKFNTDYWNAVSPITDSELFKEIQFKCFRNGGAGETTESTYWAFREGAGIYEKVRERWLPIYIEKEAAEFLNTVERLQQDVQDLLENQPQDY